MNKFTLLLAAAVVGSVLLGAELEDSDRTRLTGIVVDAAGKPVASSEVRVIDSELEPVVTGADGRFAMLLEGYTVLGERLVARDASGARMGMWEAGQSDSSITSRTRVAEARVVLRPSVAIEVRVEDVLRAPVSDAQVVAMQGYQATASTRTDGTGRATLRIPDSSWLSQVFAMKPGAGFDYWANPDTEWPPSPPPAKVTLTLDGTRQVLVRAVGSDGKPVSGVNFVPDWIQKAGRGQAIAFFREGSLMDLSRRTDADGVATFDYLPTPSSTASIVRFATASESYTQEMPLFRERSTPVTKLLTTRVFKKSSLRGKVCFPDGRPAPAVMVVAEGIGYGVNGGGGRALTRADGTFAMRVASECSYIVSVDEREWATRSVTGVVVKEGHDRDDLQLRLIRGTLVRGNVTEALSGKPLPGFQVGVIQLGDKIDFTKLAGSEKPQCYRETRYWGTETDDAGRYSVRLGPGDYRIGATWIIEENQPVTVGDEAEIIVDIVGKPE
jgi:hypothetical protein